MKKLFSLCALVLVVGISKAQIELWLGPKLGANIANVSGVDGESLMGANFGVAFDVKFSKIYSLQPEIGFSMQGEKEIESFNEDLKLNYFTVGLINKFYVFQGLHFMLGPEFNFKVNDSFSDWDDYDDEGNYIGNNLDTQPFDFAITGGIGYELPFGLTVEARYKQGLLDVSDFLNISNRESMQNQVFQIGIAYKFHLNK